jgi:hypothetical protein
MKERALTTADCGEKGSNFKTFGEKDLVRGERAYCGKQWITYLLERNSAFVFGFGTNRFLVYNQNGGKVNILTFLRGLWPGERGEQKSERGADRV